MFEKAEAKQDEESRSTWACELKSRKRNILWTVAKSHAPRERVSWNYQKAAERNDGIGHAPRERVSWNDDFERLSKMLTGHAPRERVSWNDSYNIHMAQYFVTLHVSVWVEIIQT